MKIFVKSAKMKYFSKEEGKFFNFSPTIRRIKNIETEIGFLETDSKRLINELKANELFLFVEGEEEVESEVKVEKIFYFIPTLLFISFNKKNIIFLFLNKV